MRASGKLRRRGRSTINLLSSTSTVVNVKHLDLVEGGIRIVREENSEYTISASEDTIAYELKHDMDMHTIGISISFDL